MAGHSRLEHGTVLGVWLAVAAAFVAASYFAVRFPDHRTAPIFAVVGIVAMASPSFLATARWLGPRRGTLLLVALAALAYAVESFGLIAGWPYGEFAYGDAIGPKIAGSVPVLLPFAYVPLVLSAVSVACRTGNVGRAMWYVIGVAVLTGSDLVIDPGAVAMHYWTYADGGPYYQVPVSNYVGWILSGTIALAVAGRSIAPACADNSRPPPLLASSAFVSIAYWSGIALWLGYWIPCAVGAVLLVVLLPSRPVN